MPGFAGFDRADYPGDAIMGWLKANTNLSWCGYYLAPAPSHASITWMGKQAGLRAAGWGVAPVFVGQQVTGPGSHNSSAATGVADGNQAVSLMEQDGFTTDSCVYLDLENGPPLSPLQSDYVTNWCDAVSQGGYAPGVYCSHLLAQAIFNLRPGCRIWVFKLTNQPSPVPSPFPDPDPSGSGYAGATAWQLAQNCAITVPLSHSALTVDLNSATVPDPGAPPVVPQNAVAAT